MNRKNGLLFTILAFVLVIFYALVAAKITEASFVAILLASTLVFLAFFVYYRDLKGNRKFQFIVICLFMIDLALVIYNSVYRNLPFTGVDWSNFDYFARNALVASNNIFEIFSNSIDFFTACVAVLYRLFGEDVTIAYFYILPLSFILAHYLYKTVLMITENKEKATLFSVLILIMPVNFIFSLSVLREIPIQCIATMSLYYFLLYLRGERKKGLFRALTFATLAALMHSGMIAILITYLYVFFQKKIFKKVKILRLSTVLFAILLFTVMSLPIFSSLTNRFDFSGGLEGVVSNVSVQNKYLLDASTNYISSTPSDFFELVLTLPYRLLMFVIAPLPWQVNSLGTLVAFFVDAVFRYYIVFRVIKTMFRLRDYSGANRETVETLFTAIALFDLIFCLGTTNYGQGMRHRAKMLPFELALLAVSNNYNKGEKSEKSM